MAAEGARGTSSLFAPLDVADVLIPNEEVRYVDRKHGASLLPPFIETLSILVFITMVAGALPDGAMGGFLFMGAVLGLLLSWRQRKWSRLGLYLIVGALLLGFVSLGAYRLAVAAVIVIALRFVYRFTMWAFYERLYITNRRLMLATGFLGAEIATIPLTRATDIAYRRTVPGEILGYGNIRVETAGQDQALSSITFLNRPDEFYNILIGLSTTAVGSVRPTLAEERAKAEAAKKEAAEGQAQARVAVDPELAKTIPNQIIDIDDEAWEDGA